MVAASQRLEPFWQVRVGIHQGPVVAGIMGSRQYLFDLWGDTVNTAARIVGQAEPGTVLISGSAFRPVHDRCRGTSRGEFDLKGKGMVELVECHAVVD